jgi:uncharacterized protein DUF4953/uncharacterized protein DUF5117/uncharacterized protein DUF5118
MRPIIILSLCTLLGFTAKSQIITLGPPKTTAVETEKKPLPDPRKLIKSYDEVVTKNYITKRGLFTVHQNKDTFYFEIPKTLLRRDIQVINRLVKGPGETNLYSGEEFGEKTIEFDKCDLDSTIRILYVSVLGKADSGDAINKSVVNSYANSVAISFPIKAYSFDSSSYVIDVSAYIKSGTSLFNDAEGGMTGADMKKYTDFRQMKDFLVESVHTYPINVEIKISRNGVTIGDLLRGLPANQPVTLLTNTSFIVLPEVPMQQRTTDPRVGYFADFEYHFSDNQHKVEKREFIYRWRLEPRDEDRDKWKRGEMVEPRKPIVIYIDPATPKKWRPYLIAGINDWQKAFEQAGFKNAIQGKEWPEGDTSMNMDDARYSFLNYLPSPVENAYGPNVHDPRSGEIIQTHIGWYHNVMQLLHDWYFIQAAATDPAARKPLFDDELMGNLIRFVSSHEVGHTLGLRHNFGSSSQTPVDSMRSKAWLDQHGHTASIMDYARFNYVAQPEDHIPQYDLFPRIGEYDKFAIEWGYKNSNAGSFEEDKRIMRRLIVDSISKNPRLWFGDGETKKFDPRCQTEDLGDNAMRANAYGIKNLKRVMAGLPEWTKEDGGVYENMGEMYKALKAQYTRYIIHVLKNIGGVYATPKSEGESGAVIEPVPASLQREALSFYEKEIFTAPMWLLDSKVTSKVNLPSGPDFVEDIQVKVLNSLLDTSKINQLVANQRQFKEKAYPFEEYLNSIHKMIWKDLAGTSDSYHRNLQKAYVGDMQNILLSADAGGTETDSYTMVREDFLKLQREVTAAVGRTSDPMTKAHLRDLESRIKKTLNANITSN